MPEYTISPENGDDWPSLPVGGLAHRLLPRSVPSEVVTDSDVLVFRVGGATVSTSWELAGTRYVGIEGAESSESADRVAAEIAQRLGDATGTRPVHRRVTD
ncbi:hypothetical protein ACFUGD_23575 [Streptomyces sp. NPDC057217]|uniref:hypothetical protein n=1 Tax=unclassified Streptomyces TaxID=2593676 RepID=UPI00362D9801